MAAKSIWSGVIDTIRLAVPLILAQVAIVAVGMVDTFTFGRLGTETLAGGALGNATFWLINIFCIGVMSAVSNLIAYSYGAGDDDGIRRAMRAGFIVAIGLGFLSVVIVSLSPYILLAAGQKPDVVEPAAAFMRVVAWSVIPSLLYITMRGLAIGLARPGPIAVITVAALVLKIILNAGILYYAKDLTGEAQWRFGLMACGAANIVINVVMAIWLYLWLRKHCREYMSGLWGAKGGIGELLRLGLPMGATYGVESGLFSGAAFTVGLSGAVALASHQIALQFASLTFMLAAGLAQSASARVGHEAGSGNMPEARRLGWQAILLGLIIICVPAFVFINYGANLADWLVAPDAQARAQVISLSASLLVIAGLFQWGDATQTIAMSALRGLKQSRITMIVCTIGYWVIGLPLVYILHGPLGYGPAGAWWGLLISLYVTSALLIYEFDRYTRPN